MRRVERRHARHSEASPRRGAYSAPEGSEALWQAFLRLSGTRGMGPHGPTPIAFAEIAAYARLMRVPLEPEHVDILPGMDRIWLEHVPAPREAAPEGVKTIPRTSG